MQFTALSPYRLTAIIAATNVFCFLCTSHAQPPKQKYDKLLTIIDHSGKEHKLATWKFTVGTRRLTWIASGNKSGGLEVLDFSEGTKPPLRVRILNLIPLRSIRSLEYDHKKRTVSVQVATKDKDVTLVGITGYVNVNVIDIDAEAEFGNLGKAKVRFRGGVKRGILSIRFPSPQPIEALPEGLVSVVSANDRDKTKHQAIDLKPIWSRGDGTLYPGKSLQFEKTIHIGLDKIKEMNQVGGGAAKRGLVFDVTLKTGLQKPLILVQRRISEKKRAEFLLGLIGRVESGYKLFPMQTIGRLTHK